MLVVVRDHQTGQMREQKEGLEETETAISGFFVLICVLEGEE